MSTRAVTSPPAPEPSTPPLRHQPYEVAARWSPLARRVLCGHTSHLTHERWSFIAAQLQQGDVLADALVDWMHAYGMREARGLVERALCHGSARLDPAILSQSEALSTFLDVVGEVPDWVDVDLIERGGRFLDRTHPAPYYVLRNMGLLAGYTWSDLNHPLLLTGALRSGATRRVTQTMSWFSQAIHPHALRPGERGHIDTIKVRLLHATVRRHLLTREDWDTHERGLPINQTDMAATWLAFSVVLLLGLRMLGVPVSQGDAHAVMHLFKYACWLMGVEVAWLTDDELDGRALLFDILSTYRGPDESSAALSRALADQTRELEFSSFAPLNALLWRVERSRHLGTAHLFLGPKGMLKLGLSPLHLPWYPCAIFGYNLMRGLLLDHVPSLQAPASARGLKAREALMDQHWRACRA